MTNEIFPSPGAFERRLFRVAAPCRTQPDAPKTCSSANDLLTDTSMCGIRPTRSKRITSPVDDCTSRCGGCCAHRGSARSRTARQFSIAFFGERVLRRINGQRFASAGRTPWIRRCITFHPFDRMRSHGARRPYARAEPVRRNASLSGALLRYRGSPPTPAQWGNISAITATRRWHRIATPVAPGVISREEGDDHDYAGGMAVGTSFERSFTVARLSCWEGELFVEYRR